MFEFREPERRTAIEPPRGPQGPEGEEVARLGLVHDVDPFAGACEAKLVLAHGVAGADRMNLPVFKGNSASAHFVRQYSVKNSGGTTSQVYAAQTIGTDSAASTSVTLSASDANDQLVVECTGIASETWRWVASVDAVEVSWAT